MIPKVVQSKQGTGGMSQWRNGSDMGGLVRYLTGPGKANEHTNPRLVASSGTLAVEYAAIGMETWQSGAARELGRIVEGAWREAHATREKATQATDRGHVFHVSLSLHRDEGTLDDQTWGRIARDYIDEMGFSTVGKGVGERAECQWVAVHHGASKNGNDHIHLAVCLVREDGTWASDFQSMRRSQRIARELEVKYGLARLHDNAEERGLPGVHRAESEQAARGGRPEPDRVRLARAVRAAAAQARTEQQFVAGLLKSGVRVRPRFAVGGRERVVGYSVALRPGPGNPEEQMRWFGGGRLARDLTLPTLRQRWGVGADDEAAAAATWRGEAKPAARPEVTVTQRPWWELAERDIAEANRALAAVDPDDRAAWRGAAADAAGVFAAWSLAVETDAPGPLAKASDALARSSQWARGEEPRWQGPRLVGTQLQLAARGSSSRSRQGWLAVMRQLDRTTQAIHRAHEARGEAVAAQRMAKAVGDDLAQIRQQLQAAPPAQPRAARTAAQASPRAAARADEARDHRQR